ncbi:ankyrin [Zopfia rhizophila CBS 207.26]|uniref:Ankyrin n=1 Tax=Zopfia rhizophila CBS 207.26 TaxID=1314779 RepID=A0A6A6DM79_9PEZI|nr:ankyrin [Zopfia rhizophila CBS 207.26]
MAEALAGIGATASLIQLLSYVLKTSRSASEFAQDFEDAPSEINGISHKLLLLNEALESLSACVNGVTNDDLLPLDLRLMVRSTTEMVDKIITRLKRKCDSQTGRGSRGLRRRLRYAAIDAGTMKNLLSRLAEAETTLSNLIQIITLRNSLITAGSIRDTTRAIDVIRALLEADVLSLTEARKQHHSIYPRVANGNHQTSRNTSLKSSPSSYVLVDCWLRRFGLYGSITFTSTTDHVHTAKIMIGYKFPILSRSISLNLELARIGACWSRILVLPGEIRIRTRVSEDSRFMSACSRGDVAAIRECLDEEGMGILHSITMSSGKTPLLLAIESRKVGAVRCLLEAGVDPNISDDAQILPMFAALGYRGVTKLPLYQVPPPTSEWLIMIRMLIQHGASVHESIRGDTITTLNLWRSGYEAETILSFFRLLSASAYEDFHLTNELGSSALYNAFKSREAAIPTIDLLANLGISINKSLPDGRTALHIAAERCSCDVVKHLYTTYSMTSIDRQDKYGCTPLYYAIHTLRIQGQEKDNSTVRFLLEKGAAVDVHARLHPYMFSSPYGDSRDEYTPVAFARSLGLRVFHSFMEALDSAGIIEEETGEQFFDAREVLAPCD